jgi:uncharacterized coiled-coil protein SlyX
MDETDQKLQRIEDKVDKIDDTLCTIAVTIAKQQTSLDEHIRRTNLLEEAVKPLQADNQKVHGALKLIGLVVAVAGGLESIVYVATHISKLIHL